MSDTVIKIENLSKQYRLGTVGAGTLRGDFQRWAHRIRGKEDPYLKIGQENQLDQVEGEYVWALKDINLEVRQGEVLGIIGKNGAGKSTLLKILSRVTGPTKGTVNVKGRIASLLEVGTGFHQELTGRENIFLNGAILGMKKQEIKAKLDEIVEFAGVAKYIDTPVKRYSSGMHVRLAFAVAAHLDPEILVVDEVLAVGDAEFQKKAIGKMQNVSENEGRTVLFVSHNMASIKQLCITALLLQNGKSLMRGDPNIIIDEYLKTGHQYQNSPIKYRTDRVGFGNALFQKIRLISGNQYVSNILIGKSACFELEVYAKSTIINVNIVLSIYNSSGILITSTSSRVTTKEINKLTIGKSIVKCYFNDLPFQVGNYYLSLAINQGNEICDYIEQAFYFEIIEDDIYNTGKFNSRSRSLIFLKNDWELITN
jgi:lipopolysaccharide transport system ATP-binding protein